MLYFEIGLEKHKQLLWTMRSIKHKTLHFTVREDASSHTLVKMPCKLLFDLIRPQENSNSKWGISKIKKNVHDRSIEKVR